MIRYLYPLVILGLVIVFCRWTPLSFPADRPLGGMFIALGAIGITVAWPFLVGKRLHELSWRKLAGQLGLAYKPYGTGGEKPRSARVEGIYRGRELRLTTQWTIRGLRRRRRSKVCRTTQNRQRAVRSVSGPLLQTGFPGRDIGQHGSSRPTRANRAP